jgi:hypothetical protein
MLYSDPVVFEGRFFVLRDDPAFVLPRERRGGHEVGQGI